MDDYRAVALTANDICAHSVKDGAGQKLAHVYFEDEPGR
jgi:hypothetical protein